MPKTDATSIVFSIHFEVSQELPHAYSSGSTAGQFTMLETVGGGLAVVDFDHDGLEDLCLSSGGTISAGYVEGAPISLLRCDFRGRFRPVPATGAQSTRCFSHGITAPDLDCDGFADLVITGFGGVELFLNRGDGTLALCEPNALPPIASEWLVASAAGDLNGDSFCDLYVSGYLNWSLQNHPYCRTRNGSRETCSPREFEGVSDIVLFSQGDGTYRQPLSTKGLRSDGKGLGIMMTDLDGDHDLDIYVANDGEPNFLFENLDPEHFREIGVLSGAALNAEGAADGSMGVSVLDENHDGRPDLLVSNYELETNAIYHNQGQLQFLHSSRRSGLAAIGRQYVSWGIVADDLDCDGDQDIVFSNGHVLKHPSSGRMKQTPVILENTGEMGFVDVTQNTGAYCTGTHHGRAVVGADLDVDGDRDLIFHCNDSPAVILSNTLPATNIQWLELRLIGRSGTRDPVGGRITMSSSLGRQHRFVCCGESFASSGSRWLHFGLPASANRIEVEVSWPSGHSDHFSVTKMNRRLIWIEGRDPVEVPVAVSAVPP